MENQKFECAHGLPRRRLLTGLGIGTLLISSLEPDPIKAAQTVPETIVQPGTPDDPAFIARAFEMRERAVELGDQSYGAVVVLNGLIAGQSWSRVIIDQDPSGHAEMAAIRDAARRLKSRRLSGAVLYSSLRPCPMCEAAAYWAGIEDMKHGRDAASAGRPKLCG